MKEESALSYQRLSTSGIVWQKKGQTPMFVAKDGRLAGYLAGADTVKGLAETAIARLLKNGTNRDDYGGTNKRTQSDCENK